MRPFDLGGFARAAFFALLPAATVGGALALPVLLCLAGAMSFRPSALRQVSENKPIALGLLLAFVAWVAASALWSPNTDSMQWLKLLLLSALGLLFAAGAASAKTRLLMLSAGQAALLVMAPLLAAEILLQMPLNRAAQPDVDPFELTRNLSRATSVLTATAFTVAAGLIALGGALRLALAALAIAAAAAIAALQPEQTANLLAILAGAGIFALALATPRVALLAVTGVLGIWVLAAPFVTPLLPTDQAFLDSIPYSWAARVGIWDYVCARIWEQPLFGHGLEAARLVTERIVIHNDDISALPIHPHSASLQIWFETGLVGALLAAATLFVGGWKLAQALKTQRAAAAGVAASLAALGLSANVSYSLWQEWWLATLFIAAALAGAVRRA
ncbi:MAG TPA: O-antigen ligase family protein [Verrucomicrobiae bacterium]|nr:O-antigen ligase family protein [Verrucomicrobiae bacterium]